MQFPLSCGVPSVTPLSTPLFSLIIATLHDDGDLARCLTSLSQQRQAPDFEVIVVDQNGDDRLVPLLASFSEHLRLQHLRVDFRGASRARNQGAAAAQGHWLGFPDDDCELLPDVLQQAERCSVDPHLRVITGQTQDEHGMPNLLRWEARSRRFDRWSMFGCLTEATLFVQRELFLEVGGFDTRFGPGGRYPAAEGVELMDRLFARIEPGQACYEPAIRMRHPSKFPPWNRLAVGRFHSYAIGDGALIAKSPRLPMLNWGLRTLLRAGLTLLACDGWRSAAFAARGAGLLRGFLRFQLERLLCRD